MLLLVWRGRVWLQWLVVRMMVMRLNRLHMLHVLRWWRVLVMMVMMLLRLDVLVMWVWLILLLLLVLLVLVRSVLLCALRSLGLGCDGTNASFGSCLCRFLCSERSLALLDCTSHVAICPPA